MNEFAKMPSKKRHPISKEKQMVSRRKKWFAGIFMALVASGGLLIYRYTHPPLYRIPNESNLVGRITFFAIGDQGGGSVPQWRVAEAMEKRAEQDKDLDFVILLGDNFYIKEPLTIDSPYWSSRFENVYSGEYLNTVPFYAVLGNHDYREEDAENENGMSRGKSAPSPSMTKATNTEVQIEYSQKHLGSNRWRMPAHYYSKDFGAEAGRPILRIVFLDTNLDKAGLSREAEFIKEQFAASPIAPLWKIAVGHHPLNTYGKHHGENAENAAILLAAMREANVDIYISGHEHNEQVIVREGEPYQFISGAGGKSVVPVRTQATDLKYSNATYGFLEMQVDPAAIDIALVDADAHQLAGYRIARNCNKSKAACLLRWDGQ